MKAKRKSTWLKNRGYLHLTKQINVHKERGEILGKVKDAEFVKKHAFFPLIHTNIKVRRYKRVPGTQRKAHSLQGKSNAKLRPLHYSTHIDSMVFGYYGEILQTAYLKKLEETEHLSKCVTAYRRIADPGKKDSYKSTIHFAHEVFVEIGTRASEGCWVLKFDIEKFFSSMDHGLLKKAWIDLIKEKTLPDDHYNVFKAATKFSFILKDDLRMESRIGSKKCGYDEKKLSEIRKQNTVSFFRDPKDLREFIRSGSIKVYKNEFRNSSGEMIGIPQGLPISATLANLYLLEFDKLILSEIVDKLGAYYRRYSDDIIIICNSENKDKIIDFLDKNLKNGSKVEISLEKTEQYYFSVIDQKGSKRVMSHLLKNNELIVNQPLTYLGFEYYGYKTLIKSANLSKFYRRMIFAVKSRTLRAVLSKNKNPGAPLAIFRRRLYRLYTNINLERMKTNRHFKTLVPNNFGHYVYCIENNEEEFRSNYFTYGKRASDIMGEPRILAQVRRHRTVFNQAIKKHFELNCRRYLTVK